MATHYRRWDIFIPYLKIHVNKAWRFRGYFIKSMIHIAANIYSFSCLSWSKNNTMKRGYLMSVYLSLPFTGPAFMQSFGINVRTNGFSFDYNPNFNPNMNNEFATAAFRFGHTLVNGNLRWEKIIIFWWEGLPVFLYGSIDFIPLIRAFNLMPQLSNILLHFKTF